jgi:hypothetical protein
MARAAPVSDPRPDRTSDRRGDQGDRCGGTLLDDHVDYSLADVAPELPSTHVRLPLFDAI